MKNHENHNLKLKHGEKLKSFPSYYMVKSGPQIVYKEEWQGWPQFLQNGQKSEYVWATYEEASKWAQENGITSSSKWHKLGEKRPSSFPRHPHRSYKDQWIDWSHFLQSGRKPLNTPWVTYQECKAWVQENGITSTTLWKKKTSERPQNIPSTPDSVYKDQWKGWREFLKPMDPR